MLNCAIIGLGRWGQVLVDSVQGKSDKISFVRGVTRTPSKVQDYARAQGFPLSADYADALGDPSVAAVVLATPHTQHAEQMSAATKAGKHIFVEKPFTLDKASAQTSVDAAQRAGLVLALGHNRRFLPPVIEMKKRIERGDIGKFIHADANFSGNPSLRHAAGHWRTDADETPAGSMSPIGIHMLDLLICLCGPIRTVHAQSLRLATDLPIDDTTSMTFRFESGMSACFATLGATARTMRLQIFGTKGWLELRDESPLVFQPMEGPAEVVEYPAFDKERAELEAFADAIAGKAVYPLSDREAVHGIAVFDAIVKSAETGATVTVG